MTTSQKRAISAGLVDGFQGTVTRERCCFEGRIDAFFTDYAHEPILLSSKRELGENHDQYMTIPPNMPDGVVAGIRLDVQTILATVQ